MEIKYDVAVTAIGNLARTFLENNSSIIILDEGIRPNLADMVVQHTHFDLQQDIVVGDKLTIGAAEFTVVSVGDVANDTIREEGHCTLVFNAEGSMPGQILLKGPMLPVLQTGSHIVFSGK
ncbi:MAG: PTS glucitol/sorbitol transporter subunit IIA [Selenomonadaceae bacterium]|nr:PTS glucitol/sorbitol transporter subunit IIA [Selenomonadaceae bacterium]